MFHMGENKRNYGMRDFRDWLDYLSITDFRFPAAFPHKSLNALRMTIANPDDKLRMAFCKYWHVSLQISSLPFLILSRLYNSLVSW